jgi:iron-sulfur cluster insertion protein
MLTMTDKAADKVRFYAGEMPEAKGRDLRIFVQGGGCSGFEYGFTFDELQEGDTVVESAGLRVLVDPMSAPYLAGATIDFVDDARGAGFVVDNPNAAHSCSCDSHSCAGCE